MNRLSTRNLNIYVLFIMLLVVLFSYSITSAEFFAAATWPAIGFAIGLYMGYRERVTIGILAGVFLGHFLGRIFYMEESIYINIFLSFSFTAITYLQIFMFKYLMVRLNALGRIDVLSGLGYFATILGTCIIGALFKSSLIELVLPTGDFLLLFATWIIGNMSGLLIFGTLILTSFYYDEDNNFGTFKKNAYGFLFTGIYVLVSYFIFVSPNSHYIFEHYSYVFVAFFLAAGILLSFRTLVVLTTIFMLMFQFYYVPGIHDDDLGFLIFNVNVYLFVLALLSSITRMILYDLRNQNENLIESNLKLENLMESTNKLLRMKDIDLTSKDSNELYIKEIFDIATSIYDNFDLAACYIKEEDKPIFLDAVGYDVDVLNQFGFNTTNFKFSLSSPEHVKNAQKSIRNTVGKEFSKYREKIPEIKECIRFGVSVDDDIVGGFSFDLALDSERSFTRTDYENFEAFQRLMNSFHEINQLNTKNLTLKNDIVLSLIETLELYDQYTGGHSEEVAFLSKQLGQRMNLSEEEIYDIYWAGIVHDIGKVGVGSEIINKASKLTNEEYNLVKNHSEFGAKILEKSEDLKNIARLVRHHHEWWNGNGYPVGLKGSEIPLGAQILCISDAVSSMYGNRPYQKSKSTEEILDEISLYTGAQFSPKVALVMMDLIKDGVLTKLPK